MAVIVDSAALIDFITGRPAGKVIDALSAETVVLSPLVIAEVLSGDNTPVQLQQIGELLQDFPVHPTPLEHWMNVGNLRRLLRAKGVNVTIPDAHVAQCAIDLNAALLTRDDIFHRIAEHTPLHLV